VDSPGDFTKAIKQPTEYFDRMDRVNRVRPAKACVTEGERPSSLAERLSEFITEEVNGKV